MIIRTATNEDFKEIEKLSKNQDYPMSSFKQLASAKVVIDKDKIIAFACFERKLEASIMLDFYQTIRNQVEALKLLNEESLKEANEIGYPSIYAFVKDPDFAKLLRKHFGYKSSNGQALYLEVSNG